MKIGDRVKTIREVFCDGSNLDFASQMGESPTTVSNWVKSEKLGLRVITKILNRYSEINPSWLLTGEGEMIKPNSLPNNDTINIGSNNKGKTEIGQIGHAGHNIGGGNSQIGVSVGRDNTGEISFHKGGRRRPENEDKSIDQNEEYALLKSEYDTLKMEFEFQKKEIELLNKTIEDKERLIQILMNR